MTSAPHSFLQNLRVMVADDHPIVLEGIKALINSAEGLVIVGEATDGHQALIQALDLEPDVLILDISLPGLNGTKVAARLAGERPAVKIVILSVHEDKAYLRQCLEIGVSGYILKTSAADELVHAIRAAATGGVYIDPKLAAQVQRKNLLDAVTSLKSVSLSLRETEVLKMAAAGNSNKAIAAELRLGLKSVETYKARGMEKLGFDSRVQLLRYALSKSWLDDV